MHAARKPALLSVNGPDNVGKTTQIRKLSEVVSGLQVLGAVHEYNRPAWDAVTGLGFADWWFAGSTTEELTRLLLASHARRVAAHDPALLSVLDRGYPMLLATAAATCAIKDKLTVVEALGAVATYAQCEPEPPTEFKVLLLASEQSAAAMQIATVRNPEPWTSPYPEYQQALLEALRHQVDDGLYNAVIVCGEKDIDEVHTELLSSLIAAGLVGAGEGARA